MKTEPLTTDYANAMLFCASCEQQTEHQLITVFTEQDWLEYYASEGQDWVHNYVGTGYTLCQKCEMEITYPVDLVAEFNFESNEETE